MSIILKNPHSILAAIQARPKDVQEIVLPAGRQNEYWEQVRALAAEKGVRIGTSGQKSTSFGKKKREPVVEHDAHRTSAAHAVIADRRPVDVGNLFSQSKDHPNGGALWLALDCVQDPHNVGAIFRAAAFFGVKGIIVTEDRAAPLSGVVYDVASGGMEEVPFAMETNLVRVLEKAKDSGVWVLGTSENADQDLISAKNDRPWLLVLGNEEKGLRRLVSEKCDVLYKITPRGKVGSLNVSVAAGIAISHLTRSV